MTGPTMLAPGARRPFDPTQYAVRRSAGMEPVKECHQENNLHDERNSASTRGDNPRTVHTAEKEHPVEVTKKTTKQPKTQLEGSTKPVTEALEGLDDLPDETLRLASLRLVKKLHTIKFNDRSRTFAEIDGWTCLVHPRAFREGELVLYFQNDSFLPADDDRFSHLKPVQMFEGKLGYRVKNRPFGTGELKITTQGYVFPLDKFPEIWDEVRIVRQVVAMGPVPLSERMVNLTILAIYRSTNWAERLGIKKWVETQQVQPQPEHKRLGKFPKHIFSSTDITRLQDCPNLFRKAKYEGRSYQESVKLDGASMTVYFVKKNSRYFKDLYPLPEKLGPNMVLDSGRFGVCSKNYDMNELQQCNYGYWKTALQYNLPAKLFKIGCNTAINGELCGDGINGNREDIPGGKKEFFVYSMFDIDRQKLVDPQVVTTRAEKLGLKHVPVLGYVKIPDIAQCHRDLQQRADKKEGEGLVLKCLEDGRSFKVLSNIYQEKHDL